MKEIAYILFFAFLVSCTSNNENSTSKTELSKNDTIEENSQPIDIVKKSDWSVDTMSSCNIIFDSINNDEYKWHLFILTESKKYKNGRDCFRDGKKINKCLYPQDIAMFFNSINPEEEGIYRILTNKVVFYLVENETKILEYGVNWIKDDIKANYFMEHLEHPLCNTLSIDSIMKKIEIELDTSIYDIKFSERLLKHLEKANE